MKYYAETELVLNSKKQVYHLGLSSNNLAHKIILVGDQDRVPMVSEFFEKVEHKSQHREFVCHTGIYKGKRLSAISTGIGTDNIDITINELDALVNINLENRIEREEKISLEIIRIGTCGILQENIPVDSFVISTHGLDLNGMLHSYQIDSVSNPELESAFVKHTHWSSKKAFPILIENSKELEAKISSDKVFKGITATAGGFYGPQGRVLRLPIEDSNLNHKIDSFNYNGNRITNLEMETSAIYGLSKLLGHHAVSINAIIANRANGTFSDNPGKVVADLINYTLDKLVE